MDDRSLLSGFREAEGEDAIRETLEALASLDDPPEIPAERRDDRDHLTDVLLDHHERFAPGRLLSLLTGLQIGLFDVVAREICARECYLLDPFAISEECVVRAYTLVLSGERRRPFGVWAARLTVDVIRHAARRPDVAPLVPTDVSAAERLVWLEFARLVNALDAPTRRVIHLAWVERVSLPQVANETGMPLERVEHLLASALDEARRTVREQLGDVRPGYERDGGEEEPDETTEDAP